MKNSIAIGGMLLALSACQPQKPNAPTDAEARMREMMGGGHMGMQHGQGMGMDGGEEAGFLPGKGKDLSALPEAAAPQVVEVPDGGSTELSPTLVRMTMNGRSFAMYGYNGQIPGPTIKVRQGSTITVDTVNRIELSTTIHSHGVRLANANDGVPDLTQEEILPDGRFRYTIAFPDEGVYWYHPHIREDIQQDMGLYGNYIVLPTKEDAYAPANGEEVLVLDDILLQGGLPVPYGGKDANFPLMGRFGNQMLVNGRPAEQYALTVPQGSVVRFFLTNVANTRTFRVRFDGAQMKLVGSDVGRYEREQWVRSLTIAPAERYIVDVLFDLPGTHGIVHESPLATYELGTVRVTGTPVEESHMESYGKLRTHDDVMADIDEFRSYFDAPAERTLHLNLETGGMGHSMMMAHGEDGIEWEDTMPGMNAMMTGDQVQWKLVDGQGGAENMDIAWEFKKGDIVKVRIVNDEDSPHPMQHPIHFHGQRFLVLSEDGVPSTNLVWKDTVLVPTGSTVDLLFDMSNPGEWMFHCHIAEHLTNGMMGLFRVLE